MTDRIQEVIALERLLHRLDVRLDRAQLEQILTPDFVEIGVSGRVYDKIAIIDMLQVDTDDTAINAIDLRGRHLSDDVVLVTYETDGPSGYARRSSLWVRYFDSWRIAFHQGTLV